MTCIEYKLWSSSLRNFLHSPVTSLLLDRNIPLNNLFLNALNLYSSLNVINTRISDNRQDCTSVQHIRIHTHT
jgi:hypothetical protein